ncbi:hypothetical protein [Methylosinus sp. LW4]|uniref:hypothetical protein n=1 Tax=Methylosinus sp. LW4 TaxID=136993 RepID=UPI00037E4B06|nr:hypothetical protein [Methylosinus sp. LW4]
MKTVEITATFEFYPDGSEATKRVYSLGATPELSDADADLFIAKGLAQLPAAPTPQEKAAE